MATFRPIRKYQAEVSFKNTTPLEISSKPRSRITVSLLAIPATPPYAMKSPRQPGPDRPRGANVVWRFESTRSIYSIQNCQKNVWGSKSAECIYSPKVARDAYTSSHPWETVHETNIRLGNKIPNTRSPYIVV